MTVWPLEARGIAGSCNAVSIKPVRTIRATSLPCVQVHNTCIAHDSLETTKIATMPVGHEKGY